ISCVAPKRTNISGVHTTATTVAVSSSALLPLPMSSELRPPPYPPQPPPHPPPQAGEGRVEDAAEDREGADVPPALREVLRRLGRGDFPANVALMHLIMHADAPEQVSEAIRVGVAMSAAMPSGRARRNALSKIWSETPGAWSIVKGIVSVQQEKLRTEG